MSIRLLPWMVAVSAAITVTLTAGVGWATASPLIALAVAGSATCGLVAGVLIGVEAAAVRFAPRIDGARDELTQRNEELTAAYARIEVLDAELARMQQQWALSADLAESHLAHARLVEARLVEADE